MDEGTVAEINAGTTKAGTNLAELKLRVVEHTIAQDKGYGLDELRSILDETKVGARKRTGLLEKLKLVFAIS